MKILFSKPFLDKEDAQMAALAVKTGSVTGDGKFGKAFAAALAKNLGVKYVLPTPSCTAALELAIRSLDIGPGDEVILPSFNFASGATAIHSSGAKPVFADIDADTFCVDPNSIAKKITKRTKAIMVVHYAGHACDMDPILRIAKRNRIRIIEDAAHSINGYYKGNRLGTIGDVGCYSFHGTKNLVTGEGGAFVTNDKMVAARAEVIREKGTNRSAFVRGELNSYELVSGGSSYLLGDVLAAIGLSQLNKISKITKLRKANADYLEKSLSLLVPKVRLQEIRNYADTDRHIFAFLVPVPKRDNFIKFLRQRGIQATAHYMPLHSSILGKKLGWNQSVLPVTDMIAASIVRLPIYPTLTEKELSFIVKNVYSAAEKIL